MKKRIFIAIELPEKIKQKLIEIQENFRNLKARFVRLEHQHLTLVFLGDIEETRISEIEQICQKAAKEFESFFVEFISLGAFPNSRRPHTLWIGIKDSEKLIHLQKELVNNLKNKGFRLEERKFIPHLTLARLKKRTNLKELIEKFSKVNFGKMKVEEIILFESELLPSGPKHNIIEKFRIMNKEL